jgi:hypothetical protein
MLPDRKCFRRQLRNLYLDLFCSGVKKNPKKKYLNDDSFLSVLVR